MYTLWNAIFLELESYCMYSCRAPEAGSWCAAFTLLGVTLVAGERFGPGAGVNYLSQKRFERAQP